MVCHLWLPSLHDHVVHDHSISAFGHPYFLPFAVAGGVVSQYLRVLVESPLADSHSFRLDQCVAVVPFAVSSDLIRSWSERIWFYHFVHWLLWLPLVVLLLDILVPLLWYSPLVCSGSGWICPLDSPVWIYLLDSLAMLSSSGWSVYSLAPVASP